MNKYGMKHRPFSIGCQPKGAVDVEQCDKTKDGYYDIVVYERELTQEELAIFELIELGEIQDVRRKRE